MENVLIAYFSHRGENYLNGRIVDLKRGNTEIVAQKIAERTGGNLYRIETVRDYPSGYEACTRIARQELEENARPRLINNMKDLERYDTIFLGYPNWWGTMPMAVWTFLESYDFTHKRLVPFCTHEGSGAGRSIADIRKLAPAAIVMPGMALRGGDAARSDREIEKLIGAINRDAFLSDDLK